MLNCNLKKHNSTHVYTLYNRYNPVQYSLFSGKIPQEKKTAGLANVKISLWLYGTQKKKLTFGNVTKWKTINEKN